MSGDDEPFTKRERDFSELTRHCRLQVLAGWSARVFLSELKQTGPDGFSRTDPFLLARVGLPEPLLVRCLG